MEIGLFANECICYLEIKNIGDTAKLQKGRWVRNRAMRFHPVKSNIMQLTRKRIKKMHAAYTFKGTVLKL